MYFVDYDTCEFGATSHDIVNVFAFRPLLEMAGKFAIVWGFYFTDMVYSWMHT